MRTAIPNKAREVQESPGNGDGDEGNTGTEVGAAAQANPSRNRGDLSIGATGDGVDGAGSNVPGKSRVWKELGFSASQ